MRKRSDFEFLGMPLYSIAVGPDFAALRGLACVVNGHAIANAGVGRLVARMACGPDGLSSMG